MTVSIRWRLGLGCSRPSRRCSSGGCGRGPSTSRPSPSPGRPPAGDHRRRRRNPGARPLRRRGARRRPAEPHPAPGWRLGAAGRAGGLAGAGAARCPHPAAGERAGRGGGGCAPRRGWRRRCAARGRAGAGGAGPRPGREPRGAGAPAARAAGGGTSCSRPPAGARPRPPAHGPTSAAHDVERARAALLAATGARSPVRNAGGWPSARRSRGRVLRLLEESERVVAAGTPLLGLGDPSRLEIVSRPAVDRRGQGPPRRHRAGGAVGRREAAPAPGLRLVEPSGFTKVSALGVEEQRVNVIADFVDPPGPLGDRYRVEVRVVRWGAARCSSCP